jgi:protein-disulfide isomerase
VRHRLAGAYARQCNPFSHHDATTGITTPHRRPLLSGKQSTPPSTRRERRAAERRDRFDTARDERKAKASSGGGGSSWINARTMTIVGLVVGVLIVVAVGVNQLGGGASGKLKDPSIAYPAALEDGNALGKADAPVLMETYGDFQCPVCANNSLDAEPSLVAKYVVANQLRIVHHDINLLGRGGDESLIPALGAYCALDQGKYWDYSHWIYNNQDGENTGGFRRDRVIQIAVAAGLDEGKFTTCLDSQPAKDAVAAITAKATNELGIDSTPTIYLNGTKYVGLKSPSEWSALIDAELAKASGAPAASPSVTP